MKTIRVCLLALAGCLLAGGLRAQVAESMIKLTQEQLNKVNGDIDYLKKKYDSVLIERKSADYALFEHIAVAALFEPKFIDDLISLTSIRSPRPDTTEEIGAMQLSPAGPQLMMLGEMSRAPIEARLAGSTLTDWQKEVLKGVLHFLDLGKQRDDPQSGSFAAKELRESAIARMAIDGTLGPWPKPKRNPTPPSADLFAPKPKKPTADAIGPQPGVPQPVPTSEPKGSLESVVDQAAPTRWWIWAVVALVVAGMVGFWIQARK